MKKRSPKPKPKPKPLGKMTPKEQMQLRLFAQKQRQTFLQTLRYALRVKSAENLPKVFQLPVAVALAPGSAEELATRFNVPQEGSNPFRIAFDSAMSLYCKSVQYGHALLSCDQLFTLDMEPGGTPGYAERNQGRELVGLPPLRPARTRSNERSENGKPNATQGKTEAKPAAKGQPHGTPNRRNRPTEQELQTFHQGQKSRLIAKFRKALSLPPDTKDLPAFLKEPRAIPLKIHSRDDLLERFGFAKDDKERTRSLGMALKNYCSTGQYLRAIANRKTRFTIDMEPAEPIEESHRKQAIEDLRARSENRRKKRAEQAAQMNTKTSNSAPAQPGPA